MAQPSIHNYINSLQHQIADTAAKIKGRQISETDRFNSGETDADRHFLFVSHVEVQAYELVGSETAYTLLGQGNDADSAYAAGVYGYISKINRRPSVVEGLVFKNNRNFDFRI